MEQTKVLSSKRFEKQLKKLPQHIQNAAAVWITSAERLGLSVIRKIPGHHDEPLKGNRKGQRSVRLNKAYRLIYEKNNRQLTIITILEVHKHDY